MKIVNLDVQPAPQGPKWTIVVSLVFTIDFLLAPLFLHQFAMSHSSIESDPKSNEIVIKLTYLCMIIGKKKVNILIKHKISLYFQI